MGPSLIIGAASYVGLTGEVKPIRDPVRLGKVFGEIEPYSNSVAVHDGGCLIVVSGNRGSTPSTQIIQRDHEL
jgi:hypothetical protein